MQQTWWLAIDKLHTSYDELKHRKVVAQGWSGLGDLTTLKLFYPDNKEKFIQVTQLLGDVVYKGEDWWINHHRHPVSCPTVMWNLMDVKRGDLIIGTEGQTVRGICEMPADGFASYRYDGVYEYAQTIGFPVEWVDWDDSIFGLPPKQQIPFGIKHLNTKSQEIIDAWVKYKSNPAS